jgi:glucosamine-6-phosphate deaminase
VRRYLDFLRRSAGDFDYGNERLAPLLQEVEQFFAGKEPGQVDSEAVLMLKRRIREVEALSAIQALDLRPEQAHFLNLPFYQTGQVRKDPIGPRDVEIILTLLQDIRPQIALVAGDLSDPHGTHRMCHDAIARALERYKGEAPEIWYYRGAWQEWSIAEADILIPLSEEELRRKISAIFKHQSQKDRAPFPGVDEREFWQRIEERNKATAHLVDQLGLPEYFAMEAIVVRSAAEASKRSPE